MSPIPLSIYVHLPWCARKCPYCDFNSHAAPGGVPAEDAYVDALVRDIRFEAARIAGRTAVSVFIGGGTPSLFRAASVGRILDALDREAGLATGAEITLEANPGSAEAGRFADYRAAGVNRLSIGVQSFDDRSLATLGRIHDAAQAGNAVRAARRAGFDNINIDLMYGLPGQSPEDAAADLRLGLSFGTEHLSWYQLTIEPNTVFHHAPPPLPADDRIFEMYDAGIGMLSGAGLEHYEVSAHARRGRRCAHNLNYWMFGDYLGIGAGAHGKITAGEAIRYVRHRLPERYMALAGSPEVIAQSRRPAPADLVLEFMLNACRLTEGFSGKLFTDRTGLPPERIEPGIRAAVSRGLLARGGGRIAPTDLGRRFVDDLVALFLPDMPEKAGGSRDASPGRPRGKLVCEPDVPAP